MSAPFDAFGRTLPAPADATPPDFGEALVRAGLRLKDREEHFERAVRAATDPETAADAQGSYQAYKEAGEILHEEYDRASQ